MKLKREQMETLQQIEAQYKITMQYTFTFMHLADAFIQSDKRGTEAIRQRAKDVMQASSWLLL